jgi:hypothetical protein
MSTAMTEKTTKPVKFPKNRVPSNEDAELDRQLEQTFPASDPPSITQPRPHSDAPKR